MAFLGVHLRLPRALTGYLLPRFFDLNHVCCSVFLFFSQVFRSTKKQRPYAHLPAHRHKCLFPRLSPMNWSTLLPFFKVLLISFIRCTSTISALMSSIGPLPVNTGSWLIVASFVRRSYFDLFLVVGVVCHAWLKRNVRVLTARCEKLQKGALFGYFRLFSHSLSRLLRKAQPGRCTWG